VKFRVFILKCCVDSSGVETVGNWCTGMHIPCKTYWQQSTICFKNGDALHYIM